MVALINNKNKKTRKCFEFTAAVVDWDRWSDNHLCTYKHCKACDHTPFLFWAIFAPNAIYIFCFLDPFSHFHDSFMAGLIERYCRVSDFCFLDKSQLWGHVPIQKSRCVYFFICLVDFFSYKMQAFTTHKLTKNQTRYFQYLMENLSKTVFCIDHVLSTPFMY